MSTKAKKEVEAPKVPDHHPEGTIIAATRWLKVTRSTKDYIHADHLEGNLKGTEMAINGRELVQVCKSADIYTSEEKVTKTRAAEILTTSYNIPFTVVFEKADGTERTLRGRLIHPEPLLGRSMVYDFDQEGERLVDHRTIKSLTVDHVKYTVK